MEDLLRSRRLDVVALDEDQKLASLESRLVLERLVLGNARGHESIDHSAKSRAPDGAGNHS